MPKEEQRQKQRARCPDKGCVKVPANSTFQIPRAAAMTTCTHCTPAVPVRIWRGKNRTNQVRYIHNFKAGKQNPRPTDPTDNGRRVTVRAFKYDCSQCKYVTENRQTQVQMYLTCVDNDCP